MENKYTCLNIGDKIREFIFLGYVKKIQNQVSGKLICWRCGSQFEAILSRLGLGYQKSCGCLHKLSRTTHGCASKEGRTLEYRCWAEMRKRCLNERYEQYMDYGGRGIKICDRWLYQDGFKNFLLDMGVKPSKKHSIERINNDGNYEPSNCRWATKREQSRNRRSNRYIEYDGMRKVIADWETHLNIPSGIVAKRIKRGWTIQAALTTQSQRAKLKVA